MNGCSLVCTFHSSTWCVLSIESGVSSWGSFAGKDDDVSVFLGGLLFFLCHNAHGVMNPMGVSRVLCKFF